MRKVNGRPEDLFERFLRIKRESKKLDELLLELWKIGIIVALLALGAVSIAPFVGLVYCIVW